MEPKPQGSSDPISKHDRDVAYWKANVRLIVILLAIWAFVSLGCSILFVDVLNKVSIGNVPLGFWMNQQGAMYVFLGLIAFYVWYMERLDKQHGIDTEGSDK